MTPSSARATAADRTWAERQLTAATLCAAAMVVLSGLWICFLLAHLGDPGVSASAQELCVLPYGLAAVVAGVLLHAHRPGGAAGWVLLAFGVSVILPATAAALVWVERPGGAVRGAVVVLVMLANVVQDTLWYTLPLWFPDERLTSRWWRLYVAAVALWMVPQHFVYAASADRFGGPNPLYGAWGDTAATLSGLLTGAWERSIYLFVGVGTAALLARLRSEGTRTRRQMRPLLVGYLLMQGGQTAYRHLYADHYWLGFGLFIAGSTLWASSFVLFVVRSGSWRISRSSRRMIAGLLVATLLTAGYVAAAAVLATGLPLGRASDALVLLALAFLLGAGLHRTMSWATGLVDRLFYGERAHPYQVLLTLAERISRAVDPEEIPATLCTTVVERLRLPGAALVVYTRAGPRLLAKAGRPGTGPGGQHFDLLHQGAVIGRISVDPREGEPVLDALDTVILSSLANQAAPALASLRLQEDLRTSREQIVTAREEERRHLRRDIHDGLGPTLAGLRLRVENATTRLPYGDPVKDALCAVSDDLGMAIREVRRITERLGPAPLGELGLSGALRQLACALGDTRTRIEVALTPSPLPALSASVEVAAYRIAAEALNNTVRHARAGQARLQVCVDADRLTLTVLDDGVGFDRDSVARGVGLDSMRERAAEIGGHCAITSLRPGTRVRAVLPRSAGTGQLVGEPDA